MHLTQLGFTCSACKLFAKNKEKIQKNLKKQEMRYIYQNKLDNACFKHDMAYGYFKYLPRRTAFD